MFERAHHQRIARVLRSLDTDLLRAHQCWFGGGTAIAMRKSEYRQSIDIDLMVSDQAGYRGMRNLLACARDLTAITRPGREVFVFENQACADRYGIRAFVIVDGKPIKFEIVHEGRIRFDPPGRTDKVCDVSMLTRIDLAASKLLANADHWLDDSVFSRDVIDLAMLDLPPRELRPAWDKAAAAYGKAVARDLERALAALRDRPGRLQQCMQALSIKLPPAAVQQRLRRLEQRFARVSAQSR